MARNILIFGVNGCAGSHLAELLISQGHHVVGTKRKTSSTENINHISQNLDLYDIDLSELETVGEVIRKSTPQIVFILVSASHFAPIGEVLETDTSGMVAICEQLANMASRPEKIVLVSSSAVYGVRNDKTPISETMECRPLGGYGLGKVLQEQIAGYYRMNHGLPFIVARPFNNPGPREKQGLVCTDYATRVVAIEQGLEAPVIEMRMVDNIRDFVDVRDVARGYALLAEKGVQGQVYNFCSGRPCKIRDAVEHLTSCSRVDIELKEISKDDGRDINMQVGDYSKAADELGWVPLIPIEQTLNDILTYQRGKASV